MVEAMLLEPARYRPPQLELLCFDALDQFKRLEMAREKELPKQTGSRTGANIVRKS